MNFAGEAGMPLYNMMLKLAAWVHTSLYLHVYACSEEANRQHAQANVIRFFCSNVMLIYCKVIAFSLNNGCSALETHRVALRLCA